MYDSSIFGNTPPRDPGGSSSGDLDRGPGRRDPGRGARPRRRRSGWRRNAGWVVALVATAPVIIVGLHLAQPVAPRLVTSADTQGLGAPRGWGHGGYPMMPGSPGASGLGPDNSADMTSVNWAGYAATAQTQGSFTSVSASWTEPAVTCSGGQTFAAFWAGLDGDGTPTVEQTGTEADCTGATASYSGWYELFPNAPVFFDNPLQPGDQLTASVVSDGGGVFTLTLTDATAGWQQSIQQSAPDAELGSAEIIAEAPSNGQQILPLSDFGTVNFTNVAINGQPLGATGNLTSIAMGDSTATLASPSAITDNNAFTVTEDTATSAGATPQPSAPTATIPTPDPTSPTTTTAPTHGHHHHHNGSASSTYGTPWGS